jgi:hypothetical protein
VLARASFHPPYPNQRPKAISAAAEMTLTACPKRAAAVAPTTQSTMPSANVDVTCPMPASAAARPVRAADHLRARAITTIGAQ